MYESGPADPKTDEPWREDGGLSRQADPRAVGLSGPSAPFRKSDRSGPLGLA